MKKSIFISLLALLCAVSIGCTKTDVDVESEEARNNQEGTEFGKDYMQALSDATEEQRLNESMGLVDKLENGEAKKLTDGDVKGSCDAIAESSTCLEYYGSFWNEQTMELNCSDSGVFSTQGCPVDMAGGCNTGMGTPADMVTWMYTRGGGEITTASLKYVKTACDATPSSQWLNSEK